MATAEEKNARDLREAMSLHVAGDLSRAERLYRRITERAPAHATAWYLLGEIALAEGNARRAAQLAARALQLNASQPLAHILAGNAASAQNDIDGAIVSWLSALALEPANAAANINLALVLPGRGDPHSAESHARTALASDPQSMRAHFALASALTAQGRLNEAEPYYANALKLDPDNAVILRDLGALYLEMQRGEEALTIQNRAVQLSPADPLNRYARAATLDRLQKYADAEQEFREAIQLGLRTPDLLCSLGMTLRALGKFDEAVSLFNQALEIDPDFPAAHRALSETGPATAEKTEIESLFQRAQNEAAPVRERIEAHHALGRVLDTNARHAEAFFHFGRAGELQRTLLAADRMLFDPDTFEMEVNTWISQSEHQAQFRPGIVTPLTPVFIVGMPRSGSTLVEQIASSHSAVQGAGELPDFPKLADRFRQHGLTAELMEMARAYLEKLRGGSGSARIGIDKQLDNVFHLGAVAALFPNARVIYCRRDIRDNALSCFMQTFPGSRGEYTNLAWIERRARTVERVMAHWKATLALPVLELRYESVVKDLETEARRLVDFLGLPWEEACLEFYRNEREVGTPSAWQVRQPIYDKSVERWRPYADFLPKSLLDAE